MDMMGNIVLVLLYLVTPAGVLWLCRKFPILGKIGPALLLYLIGFAVGNMGLRPSAMAGIQDALSSAMVPIAIPLMLFGCTFSLKEIKGQAMVLATAVLAVAMAVVGGYLIFGSHIEEGGKIGAMLTGVYTGGTINLASLKTMLSVREETFVLLNSYDMIVSLGYFIFLLSVGIPFFRKILPRRTKDDAQAVGSKSDLQDNPYKGLWSAAGMKDLGVQMGIAVLIIGISAALGQLGPFMTIFILSLTTLSIAASFLRCIRGRKYGYDVGMYCIYIFCMVVASMADLRSLDLGGELLTMGYLAFVVFGSLLIQVIFAFILRLDADTTVISSVAFICSPPFVPMVSGAMRNRSVLAPGLAIGVFGYAIGNYIGFLMFRLLTLLPH